MSTEQRIARLASQLLGDLAAVHEVDDRHAADQQRLQLIVDALEQAGAIALESTSAPQQS